MSEHQFDSDSPVPDTPPVPVVCEEWEKEAPVGWLCDAIKQIDLESLGQSDALTVTVVAQRFMSMFQALQWDSVNYLTTQGTMAKAQVCLGLTVTEHGAERLLCDAEAFGRWPRLAELVRAGDLDPYRLLVVDDVAGRAAPEIIARIDERFARIIVG